MAAGFSLKDQLFNAETVGRLAAEYTAGVPGFDGARFATEALGGFAERELMARLEWLADCIEAQLSPDFPTMADQLEAAMPARLNPDLRDDDFGHFIHGVPGILAVRHGLEDHRERALDLLYQATQRFSMEFYIRPFLNRWPVETLARLEDWAGDPNYHVRRLVSEGTRPKLPWAKAVTLTPAQTLPLLDSVHADPTRFVVRSVANHLNDLSKIDTDLVLDRLSAWTKAGAQDAKELDWMRRHALRSLIKQGHPATMRMLGYRDDLDAEVTVSLGASRVVIGTALEFDVRLRTDAAEPVIVDYALHFTKADGTLAPKVFKLKTTNTQAGQWLELRKSHKLKGDATTFRLYPGPAKVVVQVNGVPAGEADFTLVVA